METLALFAAGWLFFSLVFVFLFICAPRACNAIDPTYEWERPIAESKASRQRRDSRARLDAYRRAWQAETSRFAK